MKQRTRFRHLENLRLALLRALREDSGQDLVEYSLLLVLIGSATIVAVDRYGDILYYTFLRITRWFSSQGRDIN
jgi:Flp pilus assembly pilin Flp